MKSLPIWYGSAWLAYVYVDNTDALDFIVRTGTVVHPGDGLRVFLRDIEFTNRSTCPNELPG